jgi:hypothetical protein
MTLKIRPHIPGEPRAVREIACSSWDDFKSQLRREHRDTYFYRGHAKADWKLESPWERELKRGGPLSRMNNARLLEQLLENFKDMTIGLPSVRTLDLRTSDDWWTLGRHYGLATPLLDWTRSPYVAAFFAFTTFLEQVSPGATKGGIVDLNELLSHKSAAQVVIWSFESQISLPQGLEIVKSRTDIGHRQRAQRGVFTRLSHDTYFCLEDYLESLQPESPPLRKFLVPGGEASVAITELRMMNITFATLFPDLIGAVLQTNFEVMAISTLDLLSALSPDHWSSIIRSKEEEAANAGPQPDGTAGAAPRG